MILKRVLVLFIISFVTAENDNKDIDFQKALRAQLLRASYDSRMRPLKNDSQTMQVLVKYISTAEFDLDTKSTLFKLNLGFMIEWKDEYLTWDPVSFDNMNDTIFGFDEIWKPNIGAYDAGFGSAVVNAFDKQRLRVFANGNVQWEPRAIFKTRCHVDLTDYPYDTQYCAVIFTENETQRMYCRANNPTWQCLNVSVQVEYNTDPDYGHSLITVSVTLKRRDSIYRYVIVYPYVAASLLAVCIFLVPLASKLRYLFAFWAILILISELVFIGFELGLGTYGTPYAVSCISMNILAICLLLIVSTLMHPLIYGEGTLLTPPDILVTMVGSNLSRLVFRLNSETLQSTGESSSDSPKKKIIIEDWLLIATFIDRLIRL
ncbi:nicotinic acetylcholine receptor subunit beta3-like protein [Leptotrombidium deliense]|uniref:Nicotinic acetylcholine receptor subunit beta3-like protein n=1 Tax=Leptotrombidium deliense TaxID=299467 RepID=A0A443SJQ4_9ACAR|nr:nicotinic acetylcholine receptor subunit beta3-like protein [Leptotrombidium deliense]